MPTGLPDNVAAVRRQANLPADDFPRHIAIIMDGNGRWARQRGLPRAVGHQEGAKTLVRVINEATRLALECLTVYGFSLDNWRRPPEEVNALMSLFLASFRRERPAIMRNNIRFRHLGRRDGLPQALLDEIDRTIDDTRDHTGMRLNLALNYASRAEIIEAARSLAADVAAGKLPPERIDEQVVSDRLATAGQPDPDLIVRTAGELRLSNFLLWQISYAEFYVTDVLWPDFDEKELHNAIIVFAGRTRRFGGLSEPR